VWIISTFDAHDGANPGRGNAEALRGISDVGGACSARVDETPASVIVMPIASAAAAARSTDASILAVPSDREGAAVLATVKSKAQAPAFGRS
jgi:hypothetical protein